MIDTKRLRELIAKGASDNAPYYFADMNDFSAFIREAYTTLPALLDSHDRVTEFAQRIIDKNTENSDLIVQLAAANAGVERLRTELNGAEQEVISAYAERDAANAEIMKAQDAVGGGADDARWKPGTTAVDTLISERDAANAELERLKVECRESKYAFEKAVAFNNGAHIRNYREMVDAVKERDAANARADDLQKRLAKYES